uniref:Uncharacterized protein n=1 Tax=Arundo donax TaxID=35708 RepID=A0A0A9C8A2_ARUDO
MAPNSALTTYVARKFLTSQYVSLKHIPQEEGLWEGENCRILSLMLLKLM